MRHPPHTKAIYVFFQVCACVRAYAHPFVRARVRTHARTRLNLKVRLPVSCSTEHTNHVI